MSELLLTQLPITYFDSISFKTNGSKFEIEMFNAEHQLVILLANIIAFNICKTSLKSEDEDCIDVIELIHEYRTIRDRDIKKYSCSIEIDKLPPMHIVSIYGNVIVDLICERIEIN